MMSRSSFLSTQRAHTIKQLTQYPIYPPFPRYSFKIVLRGWYFPRHTSKLPRPDSLGHCLTSSICRGSHPLLQPKVRHINLSQQEVDRSAPVKDARGASKRESHPFLCVFAL